MAKNRRDIVGLAKGVAQTQNELANEIRVAGIQSKERYADLDKLLTALSRPGRRGSFRTLARPPT